LLDRFDPSDYRRGWLAECFPRDDFGDLRTRSDYSFVCHFCENRYRQIYATSVGIGQIRALAILTPSLFQAYREIDVQRILLSEDEVADRAENDLSFLEVREITELRETSISCQGCVTGTLEIWRSLGRNKARRQLYANIDMNEVTRDYGFIVRMRNPYNPQRTVVLLAGHTHTGQQPLQILCCRVTELILFLVTLPQ